MIPKTKTPLIWLTAPFALIANGFAQEEAVVDETKAGYDALIAGQGDTAYAFDFFTTSMLWTVIAAAMVFIMHLGFATLEAGLTQKKNTVNILFKNVWIICIGLLTYDAMGFNTHYPGDFNGYFFGILSCRIFC